MDPRRKPAQFRSGRVVGADGKTNSVFDEQGGTRLPGSIGSRVDPVAGLRPSYGLGGSMVDPIAGLMDALLQAQALAEDQREFALIRKYGIGDQNPKNPKPLNTLERYLDYRDVCFGSRRSYRAFALESERELTEELRSYVDTVPGPDNRAAQTILYHWIRKAYKIKYGESFSLPAHFLEIKQNWERLKQLLDNVKFIYTGPFTEGTDYDSRPMLRPIKNDVSGAGTLYLLGTYSQHGEGLALDVESEKNPTLSSAVWQYIHNFIGRQAQIDRSEGRWQTKPYSLWADIKELSDDFAQKVADKVTHWRQFFKEGHALNQYELAWKAQRELSQGESQKLLAKYPGLRGGIPENLSDSDALDLVFDEKNKKELEEHAKGFFTLQWDLVEAFHILGFTWGATFKPPKNVDLMHFQLDSDKAN